MEYGLQPQLVRPQLYIASVRTELYKELLEQNGITHILQVGVELEPSHPKHFKYLQLPVYDMPEQDIVASFPAAFAFIEAAMEGGGGVLVHCQAGISRSATIVIAYCMWKEHLSADAATAIVAAARDVIWPNMGFKTQLQEFEKLGWDASKWQGWSMNRFLHTRYGDESVDFMSAMLGGAPQDRVVGRQQQQQQVQMQGSLTALEATSPFALYGVSSDASSSSTRRKSCTGAPAVDADSCRSSSCRSADQRACSRSASKSPTAVVIPEANHAVHSDVPGSCGGCCRQAPSATRRMSLACYCGSGSSTGAAMHGSSSGSSHRLRRHSTGQYALAAAAAGVSAAATTVQFGSLGAFKHMSALSMGARLPEEAALLMAG